MRNALIPILIVCGTIIALAVSVMLGASKSEDPPTPAAPSAPPAIAPVRPAAAPTPVVPAPVTSPAVAPTAPATSTAPAESPAPATSAAVAIQSAPAQPASRGFRNRDVHLDAFPWKPSGTPPAPRELVPQATNAAAQAAILRTADRKYLLNPEFPANGVTVIGLAPGGRAARENVQVNDVLVALDGKRISDNHEFVRLQDQGQARKLRFWSPTRGEFEFVVGPGRVGFDLKGECYFGGEYARLKESDPKWDDDIVTAIVSVNDEHPTLAEAAMNRAVRKGFSGKMLPQIMSRIAQMQGRMADATAYAYEAIRVNPEGNPLRAIDTMYGMAMASSNLRLAAHLQSNYPNQIYFELNPYVNMLSAASLKQLEQSPSSPAARIAPLPKVDLVPGMRPLDEVANAFLPSLQKNRALKFEVEPDHFQSMRFGPLSRQFSVSFEFTVEALGNQQAEYPPSLNISLNTPANGDFGNIVDVNLFANGQVNVDSTSGEYLYCDQFDKPGKQKCKLVQSENQIEVLINDRSIFTSAYAFKIPTAVLRIRAVGAKATMTSFVFEGKVP